jgi:hypothetical protein
MALATGWGSPNIPVTSALPLTQDQTIISRTMLSIRRVRSRKAGNVNSSNVERDLSGRLHTHVDGPAGLIGPQLPSIKAIRRS